MKTRQGTFQKGVAIPFVIIVFVITTMIAGIIFTFFTNNLKQAILQERNIQAYYCTLTGIDLGTAALLMEVDNPSFENEIDTPDEPEFISLLYEYRMNPSKNDLVQPIILPDGNSSVVVKISSLYKPNSMVQWIRVEAEGTYKDAGGKEYKNKGSVLYRADNPSINEQEFTF